MLQFLVYKIKRTRDQGVQTQRYWSQIFSLMMTYSCLLWWPGYACAQQRLSGLGLPRRHSEPGLKAKQVQENTSCCQVQRVMQIKTGELEPQDQVKIRSTILKLCQFYALKIFPNLLPVVQEFQERSWQTPQSSVFLKSLIWKDLNINGVKIISNMKWFIKWE